MKKFQRPLMALFIVCVCQLASCTKHSDLVVQDVASQEIASDAMLANEFSNCKIRRIYQPFEGEFDRTALFSYNKAGNPFSVIYTPGGTSVEDHYFKYDSQNRLIQYTTVWTETPRVEHFYRYNTANQIVVDSARYYDVSATFSQEFVAAIEYDAQGRVIKEIIVNTVNKNGPLLPTRRPTYTYDNNGNLAVKDWKSSSYDKKPNPLRQNAVFQFIMRNYSKNNAAPQAKYNSLGLPLSMKPSNDFFFNDYRTTKVIYDCQ